jgi:hypothetical protein
VVDLPIGIILAAAAFGPTMDTAKFPDALALEEPWCLAKGDRPGIRYRFKISMILTITEPPTA